MAVQSALNYFHVGGLRHTADEEESLFPRLRAKLSSTDGEDLDRLENDHRCANDLHAAVDALYSEWIEAGRLNSEEEQRLHASSLQLKNLYEEHIQVEEGIVFPRAAEVLDSRTIAAIGQEFVARRK
jgi:hemerythrin-like domain-containing protein